MTYRRRVLLSIPAILESDDARLVDDSHVQELPWTLAWLQAQAGSLLSGHLHITSERGIATPAGGIVESPA